MMTLAQIKIVGMEPVLLEYVIVTKDIQEKIAKHVIL